MDPLTTDKSATSSPRTNAFRFALAYAVFASLWILLSDSVVARLFSDQTQLHIANTVKGWLFVGVTSLLLYALIQRLLNKTLILTQREKASLLAKIQAQRLLSDISDNSPDVIFAKDMAGRYLHFNREAARVTGKRAEEVLGHDDRILFPGEQAEMIIANDRTVLDENRIKIYEEVLLTTEGTLTFLATKGPLRDTEGHIYGIFGIVRNVTASKLLENALRASEERLLIAQEGAQIGIWEWDILNEKSYWSPECERLYGFPPGTLKNNDDWRKRVHPDDIPLIDAQWDTNIKQGKPFEVEFRFRLGTGETRWLMSKGRAQYDNDGTPIRLSGINMDITERHKSEEQLQLAASVFNHAREGIMITTADGSIIEVNETFTRITGYTRNEILGRNPRILSSGRQSVKFYEDMFQSLNETGYWAGEIWNKRKNGEIFAEMLAISAIKDGSGQTQRYVTLFSDVTMLKEHEQKLEYIAHYDALTGLPNRVLLSDRMRQAMTHASRREQRIALAFLDLDGFKLVNDAYGHDTGDQLLKILAERLKQDMREGDTIARLGGDEFIILLLDLSDKATSLEIFNRLIDAAAQPIRIEDLPLQVSASIGITFYPQPEDVDADQLLRQADQAMYQAKLAGKNRYYIFDPDIDRNVRGMNESIEHIRHALSANEFVLFYQPKVNMRTGQIIGAEALIRWQHPERGLLPPAVFLPVIEDHPVAIELGEWVIDSALTQMERWHEMKLDIPVSINIGALQLQRADFVDRLHVLLSRHPNVKPACIELEILETSALQDMAHISKVIRACREIGIMFALDDFGTDYSSLTYLKRLQVVTIKIDQSFVRDMLDDPEDLAILEGVMGLATAFRREAIAEGVETVAHGRMLLQLGCELAQGYGIAPPMPAADFPGWSTDWRPDPSWADAVSLSSDDLPLLYANVEHRAWIISIESVLRGDRNIPPPLNVHQCRLGTWLDAKKPADHITPIEFETIDAIHQQIHALAVTLLELHRDNRGEEALNRLDELYRLRDAILEQLDYLHLRGQRLQ